MSDDASAMYAPWEMHITGWEHLQQVINELTQRYSGLHHKASFRMVWRGQADASWGLMSSLYRAVQKEIGVPLEADLVAAENRLLTMARTEWRLDGTPALQLFARMQHVGVPTRLLDASFNPLIATWFAVSHDSPGDDARLFGFASDSPLLQLNTLWNSNRPRWHRPDWVRSYGKWGTGFGRYVWQPPALHDRLPAQNAVFLVDGVPNDVAESSFGRIAPDDRSHMSAAEMREHASIPLNFTNMDRERLALDKSPVFTFRIQASAKQEIRDQLERVFGYRFSTIYADLEGLAEYVRRRPDRLVSDRARA
ncbi:FRG domain-containing protein [Microbacterium gubbeenense]|uniref:FRG domain-containing protein n=1 Tax=Microbacterium gubbeenense TaxID=159896 RepID=UPI003F992496